MTRPKRGWGARRASSLANRVIESRCPGYVVQRPNGSELERLVGWRWNWAQLYHQHEDGFSILTPDGAVVALWCSKKCKPSRYGEQRFYRLDYLEVAELRRGEGLGVAIVGLVCARALELDATGVIFDSLPESAGFYKKVGCTPRTHAEVARKVPAGLDPFVIRSTVMGPLAGAAHALLQDKE